MLLRLERGSYTAMMEASQVSGSNAVGPSASTTVHDKAVPGHSFLTTLRCPQPATIARKQKVAINPPPRGKQRSAACGTFDPPSQRVREFPDANSLFQWQAFLPGLQGSVKHKD